MRKVLSLKVLFLIVEDNFKKRNGMSKVITSQKQEEFEDFWAFKRSESGKYLEKIERIHIMNPTQKYQTSFSVIMIMIARGKDIPNGCRSWTCYVVMYGGRIIAIASDTSQVIWWMYKEGLISFL